MIISTRYIKYDIIKLIIVAVIFFIESNIFRSYYILVSVFAIYFYFILTYVQNKNKKISLKEVIFIIVVTLLMIYIFMKFAEKFKPDEYKNLMTVRDRTNGNREGSEDAVTMISELLPTNGNLNMWMINYIINAVRILIPVELIAKGAKYLPFVIYQIISDYYLVKAILDINANKNPLKTISVCVFCAYLITSFAFEPDFGSFVRHETACFPVFVNIVIEEKYVRVPNDSKYIIKRSFNNVFKRNRHK